MVLLIVDKIIWGLCACTPPMKSGDTMNVNCSLTTGQPGLPCTISNMVFKEIFKISFNLWKAYQKISHMCFSPINPL